MAANGDQPEAVQIQIPVVALNNVSFRIERDAVGNAVILIGPIVLALPIADEAKRAVVDGLTGIVVARPGDL